MRRIPRKSIAFATAVAAAVGISGTAWADGASDNDSQIAFSGNPLTQDATERGPASLFTQVQTYDHNNDNGCGTPDPPPPPICQPEIPAQGAEVVEIDFDQGIRVTANNKLDQCDPAGSFDFDGNGPNPPIPFASQSTDQALEACADAAVGSGHAVVRVPGLPTPNAESKLTVAAFNGTSPSGPGYTGGQPGLVLHADNAGLPTTVIHGEFRPSVAGADYGTQLNVPDAPDPAGDEGAIVQFGAQVSRKYNNGKRGNKRKVYHYISASCDGDWDTLATWEYDDASTDTDTSSQDCAQG